MSPKPLQTLLFTRCLLASALTPALAEITYTHDPNGNPLTRTDARGVQTSFTYDGIT